MVKYSEAATLRIPSNHLNALYIIMEIRKLLTLTLLSGAIIIASPMFAQRPGGRPEGQHRSSASSVRPAQQQRPARSVGTERTQTSRPGGTSAHRGDRTSSSVSAKPAATVRREGNFNISKNKAESAYRATPAQGYTPRTRPGNGSRPDNGRPGSSAGSARPGNNGNRPNHDYRPGNNGGRPNHDSRPGNNSNRPNHDSRPGNNNNRPGHDYRPGDNHNRPGHGHGSGSRPGYGRPGSSIGRPGGYTPAPRPHYSYRRPGYRPPRPGGGYWGAPLPSTYRLRYWVPPRPVYPAYWRPGIPTLGTVLGLTFGSFIDAGINALYNSGYQVAGYIDNAIYLTDVRQLGYLWPEAIVNYDDGLMTGTQFYSWSAVPDPARYNMVYRQLVGVYGAPVSDSIVNGLRTATWWAGEGTGYVTLQYGYSPSMTGLSSYYTSLIYNAVY